MFSALLDSPGKLFSHRDAPHFTGLRFPKLPRGGLPNLCIPEAPGTERWGMEEIRAGVASQGIL